MLQVAADLALGLHNLVLASQQFGQGMVQHLRREFGLPDDQPIGIGDDRPKQPSRDRIIRVVPEHARPHLCRAIEIERGHAILAQARADQFVGLRNDQRYDLLDRPEGNIALDPGVGVVAKLALQPSVAAALHLPGAAPYQRVRLGITPMQDEMG
jgi:hypothetical protein